MRKKTNLFSSREGGPTFCPAPTPKKGFYERTYWIDSAREDVENGA